MKSFICMLFNRFQHQSKFAPGLLLLLIAWMIPLADTAPLTVERFDRVEFSFKTAGQYDNPFTDLDAEAKIKRPDGLTWTLPLFWYDGHDWKLRVSPDVKGKWSFTIHSKDEGLNGQSGAFECVASDRNGSIQAMDGAGHHFSYQSGRPFLFWGDTAWALYLSNPDEKLDRQAVYHYINKRAGEGVNVMHSMLLSEANWGNNGGDPFHDLSSQTINPAYWQEIDERLAYLNQQDIIGGLVLSWGDKGRNEKWAWRMFPDFEARKRYARYIAARYGAFNVYFILSGEWHAEIKARGMDEQQVKQEFIKLGDAFAQADAHNRMVGMHPMTNLGTVRDYSKTEWMSFGDYQQNYIDMHKRILESRPLNKPIVNSEYGYIYRDSSGDGKVDKHNSFGPEDMRFATWDIIMAGGYPMTGYGSTYLGGFRDPGPFNPDDPRNEIWAQQYRHAKQFLAEFDWWELQPQDDWIECAQPRSEDREVKVHMSPTSTRKVRRPPLSTYWLLTEPGRQYITYVRGTDKPVTINFKDNEEETYQAYLFNPRTGEWSEMKDSTKLTGAFTFTPPDKQDWVIVLK